MLGGLTLGGGVALGVCGELPPQPKVELAQLVVPGVVGPHCCKYLADETKVLFHGPLLDRDSAVCQKAGTHALGKDLKERDMVPDALEVGRDLQPLAEFALLAPGGGVFLVDCGGESMGQRLLCSMEVSRHLHPDGRVRIRQGFLCGKVREKW